MRKINLVVLAVLSVSVFFLSSCATVDKKAIKDLNKSIKSLSAQLQNLSPVVEEKEEPCEEEEPCLEEEAAIEGEVVAAKKRLPPLPPPPVPAVPVPVKPVPAKPVPAKKAELKPKEEKEPITEVKVAPPTRPVTMKEFEELKGQVIKNTGRSKANSAKISLLNKAVLNLVIATYKTEGDEVAYYIKGFATGSSTLNKVMKERIDNVAKAMNAAGVTPVRIEGHTDPRGSEKDNLELSTKRAENGKQYLVGKCFNGQCFDKDKVKVVGLGELSDWGLLPNARCIMIIGQKP